MVRRLRRRILLILVLIGIILIGIELGLRAIGVDRALLGALFLRVDDPQLDSITRADLDMRLESPEVSFAIKTYPWFGQEVGFRSPQPKGDPSIVILGDSFTFCWTELEDCYVTRLSRMLALEVSNMGQTGTGIVSHTRLFERFIRDQGLKPKLVILQWWVNDSYEDYRLGGGTFNDPFYSLGIWLRRNSVIINFLSRQDENDLFQYPYQAHKDKIEIGFGSRYMAAITDLNSPRVVLGEKLSQESLYTLWMQTLAMEAKLVVVIIPAKEEVYHELTAPQLGETLNHISMIRQRWMSTCQMMVEYCFDALDALRASPEQTYYKDDLHLNPTGNRVLATALTDWLKRMGTLIW